MNFRQVHLDFHTSPFIADIGTQFDKKEWQEMYVFVKQEQAEHLPWDRKAPCLFGKREEISSASGR